MGSGVITTLIRNLGTRWGVSGQSHACLACGEKNPGIHRIGGWLDPRASLSILVKRKSFVLARI
jgi:hypothetical protein